MVVLLYWWFRRFKRSADALDCLVVLGDLALVPVD
jgi:hypothetical protein